MVTETREWWVNVWVEPTGSMWLDRWNSKELADWCIRLFSPRRPAYRLHIRLKD